MKSLILDCSSGMNVFVKNDDEVFSSICENKNKHSDELLKVLDNLLVQAKTNINEIDNLCVCVGPGSFTGIRVAVSLAKGLAVSKNFKIFSLSNFDIYKTGKSKNKVFVLEGFSDFVYVRKYQSTKVSESCEKLDEVAKFLEENSNFEVYVQTEKLQNSFNFCEIQSKIAEFDIISAFSCKINNNENITIKELDPIYLRASQAEIEREKKLSKK